MAPTNNACKGGVKKRLSMNDSRTTWVLPKDLVSILIIEHGDNIEESWKDQIGIAPLPYPFII